MNALREQEASASMPQIMKPTRRSPAFAMTCLKLALKLRG
jgi:hypothetical protein